ncbi:MAG: hypothetical protein WCP59_11660 [Actinomycetota bacterium]
MNAPRSRSGRWDIDAIKAGAGVCAVFAVPLQVLALLFADSGVATLLRLGALFGFLLGAGIAAWVQQRRLPLAHGLVTALGAFVVVQATFVLGRAIVGNDLRLSAFIANLPLAAGAGLFGGFLGQWLQSRGMVPSIRRPPAPSSDGGHHLDSDEGTTAS